MIAAPSLVRAPTTRRRGPSAGGRRAAILLLVWTLSGIWDVGHAFVHHADAHDAHRVPSAEAISENHDHGHTHPELAPVASSSRSQDLSLVAIPGAAHEALRAPEARLRLAAHEARRPDARALSARRPRAPPLS